ncbi:MAG TPA: hypothetical protein VIU45_07630 [Chitinophagaceae bacterium]
MNGIKGRYFFPGINKENSHLPLLLTKMFLQRSLLQAISFPSQPFDTVPIRRVREIPGRNTKAHLDRGFICW